VFGDVIGEHGQEIGIKPVPSILEMCLGCHKQEFPNINGRFNGMAPGHVSKMLQMDFLAVLVMGW